MYFRYLWYVIRHKWYVGVELWKQNLKKQAIMHDMSKFLPSEFGPYARFFYGPKGDDLRSEAKKKGYYHEAGTNGEFDLAWLKHQKKNSHHWQYWLLIQDDDPTNALEMPYRTIVEMVCDWRGAGKAQGHGDDLIPWYEAHADKMVLAPITRATVEAIIY